MIGKLNIETILTQCHIVASYDSHAQDPSTTVQKNGSKWIKQFKSDEEILSKQRQAIALLVCRYAFDAICTTKIENQGFQVYQIEQQNVPNAATAVTALLKVTKYQRVVSKSYQIWYTFPNSGCYLSYCQLAILDDTVSMYRN